MIDRPSFLDGYARLAAAFGRGVRQEQAETFYAALAGKVDHADWEAAVAKCLLEQDKFPSIATLFGLVRAVRAVRLAPPHGEPRQGYECTCGATLEAVTLVNRIGATFQRLDFRHQPQCRDERRQVQAQEFTLYEWAWAGAPAEGVA